MSTKALIVMRTKDRPLFLARAVKSVIAQSFDNWHCAIVNDGGDVAAVEDVLAMQAGEMRDRFTLVHNSISSGMEAASNKGLSVLDADYYAIHDDDDSWDADFLSQMISYLESCSESSVQGAVSRTIKVQEIVKETDIVQIKKSIYNPEVKSFTLPRVVQNNPFVPIAFVYSQKALAALTGYDESLPVVGDWEFNLRFLQQFDIGFLPGATAYYHVRGGGSDSSANSISDEIKHQHYRAMVINRILRKDLQSGSLTMGHIIVGAETGFWANRFGEKAAGVYYRLSQLMSKIRSLFSILRFKK